MSEITVTLDATNLAAGIYYYSIEKETSKMASKTFTIRDHGIIGDSVYTLSYKVDDPCNPYAPICKDLMNLSAEELSSLREAINRVSYNKGGTIEQFLAELKRLATNYNAHGRICKNDPSLSYFDFGGKRYDEFVFGYRVNKVSVNKPEVISI